jgi:hypothetical protein
MFGKRALRIDSGLYERVVEAARAAGYASVDELVHDVLDKAARETEGGDGEEAVRKRLQGLGYLNG